MMSQIRLRQSQAGERLGPGDGRYEVEDAMQAQLKQVSPAHVHWQMVIVVRSWCSSVQNLIWQPQGNLQ